MKQPWMKWFTSDWRSDPRLRMCSLAARGLWKEMICLMHEAEPYGSLLVNGLSVTEKQLASLVGAAPREVKTLLVELEAAGVFSRDGAVVFSRRMRRDAEKAERDKANGKGGGNPALKAGVNPPVKPPDKAQKLEARTQKLEPDSEPVSQLPSPKESKNLSIGEVKREASPPKHCAQNKEKTRVYIVKGTPEWDAYAADYRATTGEEPNTNPNGGKWFKTQGQASSDGLDIPTYLRRA